MSDDRKNSEAQLEAEDPAVRAFRIYQAALAAHRTKIGNGIAETMRLPQTRELITPADGRR